MLADEPAVQVDGGVGAYLEAVSATVAVDVVDAEPVRAPAAGALPAVMLEHLILVPSVPRSSGSALRRSPFPLTLPYIIRMFLTPAALNLPLPLALMLKVGLVVTAALLAVALTTVQGEAVLTCPVHAELGNRLSAMAGVAAAEFHMTKSINAPWHFL